MRNVVLFALLAIVLFSPAAYAQYAEGFVTSGYDPEALSEADIAQTNDVALPLEKLAMEGWSRVGMVERWTPESMYGKINGRSEIYLSYGCVALGFAQFEQDGESEATIDIFLYDMVNPIQAFGVYGIEQWEDVEEMELGDVGYQTGGDAFFRKGKFYASLIPSADTPELREQTVALAAALTEQLPGEESGIWGREYFGVENDTLKYFHVDALSLEFMTNTFTAEIEVDGQMVTHFVSRVESPRAAGERVQAYVGYMQRYGEDLGVIVGHNRIMHYADLGGGYYDVVFGDGALVAGVTTTQGRDTALKAAKALRKRLAETE